MPCLNNLSQPASWPSSSSTTAETITASSSSPSLPTIQHELEKAIARISGREVRVRGASRTDAGVHALGQVVAFETASELSEENLDPGS